MEFEFILDGNLRKILLDRKEGSYLVTEGEESFQADIQQITSNIISIKIENFTHRIYLVRDKDKHYVQVNGQEFVIQEPSEDAGVFEAAGDKSQEDMLVVKAPMPGKVIKVNVQEKDEVRENQTLAIVEAMKMENEIKSSIDGFVKKIHCSAGDLVGPDAPLIELALPE